jgi:hypothetical protein
MSHECPQPHTLSPWEDFVLRHRNPVNLWIHFVSWICFMGGPLLALYTRNPWWLIPFFASGAIGTAGHALSGESDVSYQEATHNRNVPLFVTRIFWLIAQRRYRDEVERVEACAKILQASTRPPKASQ